MYYSQQHSVSNALWSCAPHLEHIAPFTLATSGSSSSSPPIWVCLQDETNTKQMLLPNATQQKPQRLARRWWWVLSPLISRSCHCYFWSLPKVKMTLKGKRCEMIQNTETAMTEPLKTLRKEDWEMVRTEGSECLNQAVMFWEILMTMHLPLQ